jgi:hypothetical protein
MEELTSDNFKELIPTLLYNLSKLNHNSGISLTEYSTVLSSLPYPSPDEINYLFYDKNCIRLIKEHFRTNYNSYTGAKDRWGLSIWVERLIFEAYVSFYIISEYKKSDDIFIENLYRSSNCNDLLRYIASNSIYSGVKCFDILAEKNDQYLQKIAVTSCSKEALLKLRHSTYDTVRVEAYKRLGPLEFLDEMLVDKSRHVRVIAADIMPHGYSVPQKALSDRAYWTFKKIMEKMCIDQIPMLLGNKKIKQNSSLASLLQTRMESKL